MNIKEITFSMTIEEAKTLSKFLGLTDAEISKELGITKEEDLQIYKIYSRLSDIVGNTFANFTTPSKIA